MQKWRKYHERIHHDGKDDISKGVDRRVCSIRSDGNIISRFSTDILGHKKRPPITAVGAQKEHSNDIHNIPHTRRIVK